MQNLGSGGEAKASPADRADAAGDLAVSNAEDDVDRSGIETERERARGGSMDAALGAENDPDLRSTDADGTPAIRRSRVGANETAAYGETVENEPGP